MSIQDVPRNDLIATARYYRERGELISEDEYRVLYKLQDRPNDFVSLSEGWNVEKDPPKF